MQLHIQGGELCLNFLSKFREYGINYVDGGTSLQTIHFCPWCGTKLPSSLRTEWFDMLEQLQLEPTDALPPELSDATWWLKKVNSNL
jgi:hypothetical protein